MEKNTYNKFTALCQKVARLGLAIAVQFTVGCATSYDGLGPNLFVKERKEAELQRDRFWLEAPIFSPGLNLGGRNYSSSSVLPIVAEVSPNGAEKIGDGNLYGVVGTFIAVFGGVAWLDAAPENRCPSCASTLLTASGLGFLAYGRMKITSGVRQYNQDLQKQLKLEVTF